MANYDAIAQQLADEDRSRVRSSVFGAADANPDQAARAKALGSRVGVPQDVAERNLNEIERRVLAGDVDQATRETPAARAFYGTPYNAKIGKDDVDNLTEVERTFQRALKTGQAVEGRIGEKVYSQRRDAATAVDRSAAQGVTEPVQRGALRGQQGLGLLMDEMGVLSSLVQQRAAQAQAGGVSYSPEVERAVRFADQQRRIERFPTPPEIADALQLIGNSKTMGEAARNAASNPRAVLEVVLESLGMSAPTLGAAVVGSAAGPAGTAAGAAAGSFATEYSATLTDVMAERGLNMTDPDAVRRLMSDPTLMAAAREKALKRAIPIAVFDALSAGLAGRVLAGARGTVTSVAPRVAGEAALQAGAGGTGEAVAQALTGEYKPGDIVLEAMAEIPTAFVEAPANFRDTLRNAQVAEERTKFIETVNKLAAASKVAQRDADTFERFVEQASQDGPVKEVYVDAQVLNQLGLAEKLAEVSPSVGQQFATALAAGGDVVIPIAEYTARVAPTDLAQGLLDHIRLAPDDLSRVEAQAFMQSAPELFQKELERVTAQAADTMAAQLSADTVKQTMLEQLTAVNRWTKDVNEAYASLAASFYASTAARFGITPEQMYERYPLRVQGANPAGDVIGQDAPREFQQGGLPLREVPFTDKQGAALTLRLSQQTFGAGATAPNAVLVEAYEGDQRRGFIDFEITPDGRLASANTMVAPAYRRRGIAQGMYQAARDAGYDLVPGRMQTPDGARMVAALQERGLVSREAGVFNQSVSTRLPTAKKAAENPLESMLVVGLESSKADPKAFEKNIELIRQYPNFRDNKSANTPDKAAEQFIRHVVDNLLWLYDQVPAETRERSKLWYDGARAIAEQWAQKYSISEAQAAGMLAVLSPQKDWFQNVSLAERVLDVLTAQRDTAWTEEMSRTAEGLSAIDAETLGEISGKTIADLEGNTYLQAVWVRVYDQTYHERGYRIVSPEGQFTDFVVNADGQTRSKTAWGSFNEIGKAVSIFYDGSIANISASLGEQHKVRNFYNNIFAPASEHGDVTIDTHAVAAGLLRPLSGSATEVLHNFGAGGAASSAIFGSKGTYGIYAEAYRRAAAERGVLPREMQSITWEAVRGLYTAPFKAQASNVAAVDAVWDQYKRRRISLDEARNRILELAGGIAAPDWQQPGAGRDQTPWASSYAGELRAAGGPAGAAGSGAGSRGAGRARATLNDFTPENIGGILQRDGWAIMTAENPMARDLTPEENAARNAALEADLAAMGLQFERTIGRYGSIENSYLILGIDEEQAIALGEKYEQDSVLTRRGLLYRDGRIADARTVTTHSERPNDFFTEVPATGTLFTIDLDLDNPRQDTERGAEQAEQRRLRQVMDLDILQKAAGGDTLQQSAPRAEQTETPSFRAWFGDSKVVDESGKPLVVYHGTNQNITAFDPARIGLRDPGFFGAGFYFTPDESVAQDYASGEFDPPGPRPQVQEVIPAYLSLQNPFLWDMSDEGAQTTRAALAALGIKRESVRGNSASLGTAKERETFNRAVREQGYDGVVVRDEDGIQEVVAFRPEQIKSATGNQGTFDPNDANILRQEAKPGEVAITGLHFSRQRRTSLNGAFYGTGLQGAERDRVFSSDDMRLRSRVYFYVDEGRGVVPEAGVGGAAHSAELTNLYDIGADPLKLASQGGGINAIESRILDAGFDGYYRASFANQAGVAVVIGPAARSIPVTPIQNPNIGTGEYVAPEPTVRVQLSPQQMAGLDEAALRSVAPNASVERSFIAVRPSFVNLRESELDAARPLMSSLGVDLPAPSAALAQNEGARGTFSPSTLTITLLEKADLSTFLHETGHFFLEALADMASQPGAPADITADMNKVLEWFGVTDLATWRGMSLNEQRKYHEKFAESFEQYLFEGKAPSKDLQPLFARFRGWLLNVYRSLQRFMGMYDTQLTDEVRAVFDRMLATEEQIKELQATRGLVPLFQSAEEAGMTPEEWAQYQAAVLESDEEAIAQLQSRSLRDLRWTVNAMSRELKKISKDVAVKRKAIEAEVRAEVQAMPVYAVQRWLKTGVMPDGTKTVGAKLNTAALREMYGDAPAAPWRYLATNLLTAEEGLHPDVVAEMFGFDSGDQMVRAIVEAFPEDSEIQGRTDQRMLERYGDLNSAEGQRRAAEEAVHNEARARMVATEMKALAKAASPARTMLAAAKQFAKTLVARKKIKDLKPSQHTAAESRAAKRAMEASASGKTQDAITAKRDQLLNFYAAKETMATQEEVDRGLKYLARVADSTTLSPDYKEQIDALLERFDLRRSTTNRDMERRKALLEWVEEQRDMGVEPSIPPEILQEANRKPYRDMTVEEFRGLLTTVKQIEHLGRLKQKLLTAKNDRDFEAARDEMVAGIMEYADGRQADTRTPNTVLGSALLGMKKFWSAHIKAATWARVMDGGKDGGPVWEYLIRSANAAGDAEITRRAQATKDISALLAPVLKLGPMGGKGTFIPEIGRSMNREGRLAVALNTGNASNLQRLMGGEGWSKTQVDAITASLTEQEWRFVQKVWDYFESFRPEIAAKEKRVSGVEPNWIEATPLQVQTADGKTVNLRGGYYPVKYDPRASERAEAHDEAEVARQQMKGAYTSATTRRSFTKDRAEEVSGRPLLYSLDGIYNGVNEVIHDLSWHEFLIDANRLVRDQKLAAAMRQTYGPEAHQQFKTWLQDVAVGDKPAQNAGESALAWVRQGVSVAGLGFNIMSALIQPLGLTQSIVRVGPQYIARGVSQFIGSPFGSVKMVHEKSPFMATRTQTRFRELAEVRAQVKGQTKARRAIDGAAYFLMMRAQQTVDVPTWIGAYEKAISEGNAEDRAIALADQAVIDAQGGGTMKDLSAVERGGPAMKLFTVFYSFFNAALNMGVVQTMTSKSKAKLAADYLLLYVMPVVLGAFLKDALTPGDSGDDDPEKVMKKLIAEQISYLSGLMFGVREVGPAIQTAVGVNEFPMGYQGPAGLRPINDLFKLSQQVQQGEADEGLRKAIVNTAGSLLRLPAAQINRSITGMEALANGDTSNPAAVIFGYQEPK